MAISWWSLQQNYSKSSLREIGLQSSSKRALQNWVLTECPEKPQVLKSHFGVINPVDIKVDPVKSDRADALAQKLGKDLNCFLVTGMGQDSMAETVST